MFAFLYMRLTVYWSLCSDNCKTSIFDYHRSCPQCSYDLCLTCCRELRNDCLQGWEEGESIKFCDPGFDYLHGGADQCESSRGSKGRVTRSSTTSTDDGTCNTSAENNSVDRGKLVREWKSNPDGSISCPPVDMGGCGHCSLELRCLLGDNWVLKLLSGAEEMVKKHNLGDGSEVSKKLCSCMETACDINITDDNTRKASSREDSNDNYLYCPKAVEIKPEDVYHFRCHWMKGEPVIVRNVLETTRGLSWEPMVMWRAFRQIKNLTHDTLLDVTAINCLDWCEVSLVDLLNCHICYIGMLC